MLKKEIPAPASLFAGYFFHSHQEGQRNLATKGSLKATMSSSVPRGVQTQILIWLTCEALNQVSKHRENDAGSFLGHTVRHVGTGICLQEEKP